MVFNISILFLKKTIEFNFLWIWAMKFIESEVIYSSIVHSVYSMLCVNTTLNGLFVDEHLIPGK